MRTLVRSKEFLSLGCAVGAMLLSTPCVAQISASGADDSDVPRQIGRGPVDFNFNGNDAFSGGTDNLPNGPLAPPDILTSPQNNPHEAEWYLPDRPAVIEVELIDNAMPEQHAMAHRSADAWSEGDYHGARAIIEELKVQAALVGVGFTWTEPDTTELSFNPDRRVGGSRTDAIDFAIDFNPANRDIFAVVQWPNGWSLNRSTNGGFSWNETYFFTSVLGLGGVDMAVVDDFVYVGYIPQSADAVRLRRQFLSTGASDTNYFFQTVLTGSGSELPIREVSVESNRDDFNNRIYIAGLKSNGTIDWAFATASTATTFTLYNPGISDASTSIDMHWNKSFSDYFLYLSYKTSGGAIRVLRGENVVGNPWTESPTTVTTQASSPTTDVSISAFEDTVIVAYQAAGNDINYHISYNGGNSYNFGFTSTAPPSKFNIDVTARLGYGTALVTTAEVGEPDDVLLRTRSGYSPGVWRNFQEFNSFDVVTGATPLAIQALPVSSGYSYGMMYASSNGNAYFDRITAGCLGDIADDFGFTLSQGGGPDGVVDFGDFVALLGLVGPCAGGVPGCLGDIADDFGFTATQGGGPDGVVDFGDFVALLGLVGPCPE